MVDREKDIAVTRFILLRNFFCQGQVLLAFCRVCIFLPSLLLFFDNQGSFTLFFSTTVVNFFINME